jgi:hypothetical protein
VCVEPGSLAGAGVDHRKLAASFLNAASGWEVASKPVG